MHFLASLHIVLTCSFVVLLAYLISKVFTYIAHSVIHGSDYSRRRIEGSSRSRRIESLQTQTEKDEDVAVMARLQEEEDEDDDETDEDEDAYRDAAAARTSKYDIGGSMIFDDGIDQEYDVKREDVKQGSWDNEEGMREEGLDATDNGRCIEAGGDSTELENGARGMRKGGAGENGLVEGKLEKNGSSSSSREIMVGDGAQGSSSPQQRLPPTWSDLERIVNLSSKEHSLPPAVSPVPE